MRGERGPIEWVQTLSSKATAHSAPWIRRVASRKDHLRGVSSNPFRFLASCLKVDTENNCRVEPYIIPNLEPAILPHVIGQREAGGESGVPHRIFAIGRVPGRGSGPKFHGLGFGSSQQHVKLLDTMVYASATR
jgi:hypothetical protein